MKMSTDMKSKQKEVLQLLTIDQLDELIASNPIDPSEIACFINVEVPLNGKPTKVTLKITPEGESINQTTFSLPDGIGAGIIDAASITQPSRGFHELEISADVFRQVFTSLKTKFAEFIFLLQEDFFAVLALASMSSYFREAFYTYPFIDFHANDLECGKTTAMKAFSWSANYGVIQTIPTPAVIYRKIHQSKGVLGLDELEDTLRNRESAGFIKGILDAAHTKGIPAERCDPNDPSQLQTFDAFGIKVFSRVGGIPNSIISRSIRIPMIQAPKTLKLKKLRTASAFREERDLMYNARLKYSFDVLTASKWVEDNCGLSHRPADLFVPILTMAKMVNTAEYDKTLKWAKKFLSERKGTYEDEWNTALVEICLKHIGEDVGQKTIRDEWIDLLRERDLISGKEPRSCTKRLDGLSLSRTGTRTNRDIHFFMDRNILYAWGNRYSINGVTEQNEFSELSEFSEVVLPPDTMTWLNCQPKKEVFGISKADYETHALPCIKKGLIKNLQDGTFRRTSK